MTSFPGPCQDSRGALMAEAESEEAFRQQGGGVDSSSVVAMAQKHTNIETFCVSFPNTEIDEASKVRQVADHLGTRHHEVKIRIDPAKLLSEAINFMDEPFLELWLRRINRG